MSGTVSTRLVQINEASGFLNQLTDVVITTASHDQTIKYDSTNWVNTTVALSDLGDMNLSSVSHNDVLIWNSVSNAWENGKLTSLLTTLEAVVNGIVSIKLSVYIGEELGDSAKALAVAFTDDVESGYTMAIGSCTDHNAIYKKEPTDTGFSFLATLNKGQRLDLTLPAGTVFKSDGIAGFSCPFPMPFGISNLSSNYFRFYALRNDNVVHVTSAGRDSLVTLLASDETTVVSGPTFISAYGSAVLTCNANAEFVVKSTTDVFCGTKGVRNVADGTANKYIDMRLVPPMATELIVHSRNNRLSARFANTAVTYHRRNMTTGNFTVQGGTPLSIAGATGNQSGYLPDGWLILRGDKPFSGFSGADSSGWEATHAVPLTALAQLFPIVSAIGGNTSFHRSSISLASPYEGTCNVYSEAKEVIGTFTLTRGTSPPGSPDDQLYPAAGQWNPQVSLGTTIQSGYIEVNVPCVCICNFEGSSKFSDQGDEMVVPGSTPEDIRAQIRKDPDGFLRRRDIDAAGLESWVLC